MSTALSLPSARRLNLQYFCMQAGFWSMYAAICGYQVLLLQHRGFTNAQIGLLVSLRCVAGILCQPVLGGFADRHPDLPLKYIFSASLFLSLLACLAFMTFPMGFMGVAAVFCFTGAFEISTYPFMDSMAIQYMNAGVPIRYSLGRGIGSLSYAVTAVLLSRAAARWTVEVTVPVHVVLAVIVMILVLLYPTFRSSAPPSQAARERPRSVAALLRGFPGFTLMLVALFFSISGVIPMSNFLVNIIVSRGGSPNSLGLGLFLMAAFELPSAMFFPRLLRRLGSAGMLLFSICFMALKAVLMLLSFGPVSVLLVQPIQMLGYGMFTSASVYFVNETVPHTDRVRGQTLLMVASNGLGGVMGNLLVGRILDWGGVNAMLIFCAGCGAVAIFLGVAALRLVRRQPKN